MKIVTINKETKSKLISYAVLTALFLGSAAFATHYEPTKNRSLKRQTNVPQKVSAKTGDPKTSEEAGSRNLKY